MTADTTGALGPDLDDTRVSVPVTPGHAAPDWDDDTVPVTEFARDSEAAVPRIPLPPAARPSGPVLRLRTPEGDLVPIDTAVILGRRPAAPRIHAGPGPRLVVLPSPQREVSASHLELRRVGETVVVSDLRSTNGTVVMLPGSPARTLLGGESLVVTAGTVLDLGDGNRVAILGPADQTSEDAP